MGGRDDSTSSVESVSRGFNSRARGRARLDDILIADAFIEVSTHAPVGGRDGGTLPVDAPSGRGFNSRARGRARLPGYLLIRKMEVFQLTRPWEGATLPERGQGERFRGFNSRARGRARHCTWSLLLPFGAFQLTRPWEGAT